MPVDAANLPVTVHHNLEEGLSGADVVMVLRLQLERMTKALFPTPREYCNLFGVSKRALQAAKPDALVMHPGPMNRGLEISGDVPDLSQSHITNQVINGVATRMAVLYLLLGAKEV
jgi:aspartate carbamoyltransferase catalytic subunit